MTIRHHLPDDLLIAYTAGDLSEAFNLVIATHVSMCDDCRARLHGFEAIGGAVLESCDAADMAPDCLAVLMARLDRMPAPAVLPETTAQADRTDTRGADAGFPKPLADYAGRDVAAVRWRPLGFGVKQAILKTDGAALARLLWIPGGQAMPDHGHTGSELTLVLQGAFVDASARFGPGDIEVANAATEHRPTADAGQPCICLTVTDGPLRFRGLLPRLAQGFARI